MARRRWVTVAAGLALAAGALGGCSSDGAGVVVGDVEPDTSPGPGATTTTTAPVAPDPVTAEATGETEVSGIYRQGLARSGDGWLFTNELAIFRTDEAFTEVTAVEGAIPGALTEQGYDHLGDPDVHDGLVWIPVEQDDMDRGRQVTARYDEATLAYVDSFEVPQHHNAWVAVADDGTVYSADGFSDDAIVRYRVVDGEVEPLEPIALDRTVERIQGGDLADGALWLSTDDDRNGLYRVDLDTGEVTDVGTMGRVEGEGEGIDATDLESGLLHALVASEDIVPMYVVDLKVTPVSTN